MVIASRTLSEKTWNYKKLQTKVGWDSHNYIDIAIDDSGYIHVSGNMHNVNLIYFRSKKPWNTEEFEQPGMVGSLETSVTYPVFIEGPQKKLLFQYRIGGSGDGVTIWNGYDLATKKWKRITDKGLFSNDGSVNAYSTPPKFGPDSCFHIVWMWRNSPVANTNHDLSHIKSTDLINWKNMAGKAVAMPVGQSNKDVVVDPVTSGNGLINMDFWISWDRQNRAVATYHRYNSNNISQIFNTRWENNGWKIYQTSSWTSFKWNLDLEGSLTHDIAATTLSVDENGELVQDYVYPKQKLHRWILNEADLKPTSDKEYAPPESMKELYNLESKFQGMQVNTIRDGDYYIKWETMPINQDKERAAGTYPSSSMLRLYNFTKTTVAVSGKDIKMTPFFVTGITRSGISIKYSGPKMQASGAATVQLITLNGVTIVKKQIGYQNSFVPLDGIRAGVYVLKVSSTNGNSKQHIVHFVKN
jgi:hypothetical protein